MVRIQAAFVLLSISLWVSGCTHRNNERVGEAARKAQKASEKAAIVLGKAGAKVAQAAGKVARKAGEQIKDASHDAHQGYVEEKQKEKDKAKQ